MVKEIERDIDSIPLHSFEFIDFKNLRSRCDDNSVLTGGFFGTANLIRVTATFIPPFSPLHVWI